jgi:hypothetical protein
MGTDGKAKCNRMHVGKGFKYLFLFALLLVLTYGGLFRYRTKAWPWEDWNAFASFSEVTTKTAIAKGKDFSQQKVIPATRDLLAKAQDLLERWEEEPVTEDPDTPAEATDKEALGIPPEETEVADADEPADEIVVETTEEADGGVEMVAEPRPNYHQQARDTFKDALKHYQRSSPELDPEQAELASAQEKFRASLDLLEKAKAADPKNTTIDDDIQDVQVFLYDCQKRMEVDTRTY